MRALALILGLLAAGQAAALSCVPPDVARTFKWADEQEDRYLVIRGIFTFDEAKLPSPPRKDPNATRPVTEITAAFAGHSLTRKGFTEPLDRDLTLRVTCLGPWCGGAQSGGQMLAFARIRDDGGFEVDIGPCGGNAFPNPTAKMERRLRRCLRGGLCQPRTDF
ncbi:hypothetical protein [Pseudaestuariivita atlantica]|uniref:DUF4124 domain-containing protein n=1 Tax=Pseudaestuariivita atlantica TaxID=1317121 RepID=A0A0L1JPY3_9RHOB|nr:hypothetical protein [Pseudaestuariivita atlantica]KNG93830.1 hypothetical protein ATO11_11725 [Pseudaestuariivita atlantica]